MFPTTKKRLEYFANIFSNIVLGSIWLYAFINSILVANPNMGDLRNRIVGARLMTDGIDPYTFLWSYGKPLRYFDVDVLPKSLFSNITATPFVHWILQPLAELNMYQIELFWFILQWLSIITTVYLALTFACTYFQKKIILLIGGLFCCTTGVVQSFYQGQYYIFIAVLMMGFIYVVAKKKNVFFWVAAGASITFVFFIRPSFAVLFLPFVFYKKAKWPLISFFVITTVYTLFATLNTAQHKNWVSYFKMVNVASHHYPPMLYGGEYEKMENQPTALEGIAMSYTKNGSVSKKAFFWQDEKSNYSLIHTRLFGSPASPSLLIGLQFLSLLLGGLITLVLFIYGKGELIFSYAFVGIITIWAFNFFQTVDNWLYGGVYLLYGLLFLAITNFRASLFIMIFVLIGIGLNIFNVGISLESTIGQIVFLGIFLFQICQSIFRTPITKTEVDSFLKF